MYLVRNHSKNWCARVKVPPDLRRIIGLSEFKYSLKTRDRRLAEPGAQYLAYKCKTLFKRLRGGLTMTPDEIKALVQGYVRKALRDIHDYHMTGPQLNPDQHSERRSALKSLHEEALEAFGQRDRRQAYHIVDPLLKSKGIDIDRNSDEYKTLCMEILKASAQLYERELSLHKDARLGMVQPLVQPEPETPSEPLSRVMQEFWLEKRKAKPASVRAYRKYRDVMLEHFQDITMNKLDFSAARSYKDALVKRGLSTATINHYLTFAIEALDFAVKHGYADRNPLSGMKLKADKKVHRDEHQDRFTSEDLRLIFSHPGFKERSDERFWLPLLACFTGARINELCQLWCDQVVEIDGQCCLRLAEDHPRQSIKNGKPRIVPLHSKLVELGFVSWVKSLTTERVFPRLRFQNDKYSHKVGEWFRQIQKDVGFKYEPRRKSFHSFRHTFASRAKELGIEEYVLNEVCGWTNQGLAYSTYGKRLGPDMLYKKVVGKMDFDIGL